jgi:ATP-dependent RNA helicase DeaD
MEVLNNVQLEGRRINVEISKNDGGGRRDHNGRSSSGGGGFAEEFCSKKRRQFAPRREGSGGGEATETQVLEGDLVEEALLQEKVVLAEEVQSEGEGSSDRAQDVLKVLVTHQTKKTKKRLTLVNFLVII